RFPYTTLFRSNWASRTIASGLCVARNAVTPSLSAISRTGPASLDRVLSNTEPRRRACLRSSSTAPSPRLASPGSMPTTRYLPFSPPLTLLVFCQVTLQLPTVHGDAVLVVLERLVREELLERVLAQGIDDDAVAPEVAHGLAERGRQLLDLVAPAVAHAHLVDVPVHGRRRHELPLEPVYPRGADHGQREVRVARGVWHPQLGASAVAAARGDADHRAAVGDRPRDVRRRLVPGREALVGVHGGVGDGHERGGVLQVAGDPPLHDGPQPIAAGLVGGRLLSVLEHAHVAVHARAVDAVDRLGHEGRVQAVVQGYALDHGPEREDVVGRRDGRCVLEVDLVLTGGDLVVRRLDLETHGDERVDHVAAGVLAAVHRREVEVAGRVVRRRG